MGLKVCARQHQTAAAALTASVPHEATTAVAVNSISTTIQVTIAHDMLPEAAEHHLYLLLPQDQCWCRITDADIVSPPPYNNVHKYAQLKITHHTRILVPSPSATINSSPCATGTTGPVPTTVPGRASSSSGGEPQPHAGGGVCEASLNAWLDPGEPGRQQHGQQQQQQQGRSQRQSLLPPPQSRQPPPQPLLPLQPAASFPESNIDGTSLRRQEFMHLTRWIFSSQLESDSE